MTATAAIPVSYPLLDNQLRLTLNSEMSVATLHLNSPQSRNAISFSMAEKLSELAEMLTDPQSRHPLRTVVEQGRLTIFQIQSDCPRVFISGGNLKELSAMTEDDGRIFTGRMRTFTDFLRRGPLVTVARLCGPAAGGGAEIALAADLRIATSPEASVHFAQTRWGVPAGWGMMSDLTSAHIFSSERRCGIALASQEKLDLDTLVSRGLVDARFDGADSPDRQVEQWLQSFAERLAQCPLELRNALVCDRPSVPAAQRADFDNSLFEKHWLSTEHRQRLNAFAKKNQTSEGK